MDIVKNQTTEYRNVNVEEMSELLAMVSIMAKLTKNANYRVVVTGDFVDRSGCLHSLEDWGIDIRQTATKRKKFYTIECDTGPSELRPLRDTINKVGIVIVRKSEKDMCDRCGQTVESKELRQRGDEMLCRNCYR